MDVQLDAEQQQLRDTARDVLEAECGMDVVRARMDDPHSFADALWKQLAELGWLGLHVPVEHGGAGLDLVTLSLVLEQLGRALAPTPYLATALVLPGVLARYGTPEQQATWLPGVCSGAHRFAIGHLGPGMRWDAAGVGLSARDHGDDGDGGLTISGPCHFVQDGLTATHMLASVHLESGGIGLVAFDLATAGVERRAIDLNEKTRSWAEIHLDAVQVGESALVGGRERGGEAFGHALTLARTGLAAELTGAGRRVLEMSVDYARTREQFGQPIGQFQAIAHKCANMLVAVESMTSAAMYAAWSVGASEPDASTTACLAKSFCSDAYTRVAGDAIQVHGGLGFTWEQDLHLFFKHAQAAEFLYGHSHDLREIAARHLIDGD